MTEESLKSAAAKLGEGVTFEGLMSKKAHLRNGCAKDAKDVLGWDYIVKQKDSGICYKYYAAQPPLIGMTRPVVIKCPLGVRSFDSYKVDFKEAINIFHKLNCGDAFTEMALYYVLYPGVNEPHWYIRSITGCTIVIGADSGKVMDPVHRD
jgi:hypothetical protein